MKNHGMWRERVARMRSLTVGVLLCWGLSCSPSGSPEAVEAGPDTWTEIGRAQESLMEPPAVGLPAGQPREAAGRQAPARGPAVEAWRREQGEDSALALARAFFPEFSGHLEPEARQEPVNPEAALRVRLAATEDGAMEVVTRGYTFRVLPQEGGTAPVSKRSAGATFYGAKHFWTAEGGTAVPQEGLWLTQRVEEFVVVEAGGAPYRTAYEVQVPEGIESVRDAGEYLEFLDSRETPVVRMHYAVARDGTGRGRQGTVRLWGATPTGRGGPGHLPRLALARRALRVEMEVGLEGLEGPVVVDPGWSATGTLAISRYRHSATLLPTGKVLVAGGRYDNLGFGRDTAELYDPATGAWSSAGTMATTRYNHTATLLPNGKVLIAGGSSRVGHTAGTELYDPATGSWTSTGLMNAPRGYHTATLLPNGKVMVIGGAGASTEVYDPATGSWSPTASLAAARLNHAAVLLPSGRILVTGGENNSGSLASAELYDPATNSWSATGAMGVARNHLALTLLATGKVLALGGSSTSPLASAELYDPATGTWSGTGSMTATRSPPTATLLPNGKVLVAGGATNATSEVYNPATGTWSAAGLLSVSTSGQTATLLPMGKVLVAGGINDSNSGSLTHTQLYDALEGAGSGVGTMAATRQGHTTTLLPGGKVLVVGGQNASGLLAGAELYDPAAGTWSATGSLSTARSRHTASLLSAGKVLVVGGDGAAGALASAELYDPVAGTWSTTGTLATARGSHTATLLPGGKVLVLGGSGTSGAVRTAELYAPAAGTWSATGSLGTARSHHTATVLPTGRVLVAGGRASSSPVASAELYDPATGTFRATGSLATARAEHTATVLPGGKVLLTGGTGASSPVASAEVYDSAAGTFSATGSLNAARSRHRAVPLPMGRVLVAAGLGTTGRLATVEAYDPTTGTFSTVGTLTTARADPTATLLPDGKVLVAGGSTATGSLASAEVYEATGSLDAWRPTVAPPVVLQAGAALTISGNRLRGISEASNGNSLSSPTNFPLVFLQEVEDGKRTAVPWQQFSNTSIVLSVPGVADGFYLLTVTVNAITGGAVLFIDGPPPAPVLTAPAPFVNTQTPAIMGTAEAGSTVTISLDGDVVGTVTANASGDWSLTLGTALDQGPYTATATATDASGNTSAPSAPRTFTVDLLAPAAPLLIAPTGLINTATPVVTGTAEPGSTVTVTVDGAVAGTVTASASESWSFTLATPLAQGAHSATATATDAAGNASAPSAPLSFTVDSVAPASPVLTAPAAAINTTTPTVTGTAEPGSTVTVTVDGTVAGMVTASASGDWSFIRATPLGQGAHTVTATARDAAGNTSAPSALRSFTVDSVAPASPVLIAPAATLNTTTPTVTGTAEPGSTVTVTVDGAVVGTVTVGTSGTWSITGATPLAQGAHTAIATATDAAGNTSAPSFSRGFTVDSVAPNPPVITDPAAVVKSPSVVIAGTAESGTTVTVTVDGVVVERMESSPGSGAWGLFMTLAEGAHTVTATATDRAGNTSAPSAPYKFTVASSAPDEEEEQGGCGCATSPSGGFVPMLSLLALWMWRRRSRA